MTAPAADFGARHRRDLRPDVPNVGHTAITSLTVIMPTAAILFLPIPIAA